MGAREEGSLVTVTEPDIAGLTTAHVPDDWTDLDTKAVDTARVLAADAVQKVGNGHPGTAMSLAPLAYTLYQRVMDHDPDDTSGSAATGSCCRPDTPASPSTSSSTSAASASS